VIKGRPGVASAWSVRLSGERHGTIRPWGFRVNRLFSEKQNRNSVDDSAAKSIGDEDF
jgi:hypothetical protein